MTAITFEKLAYATVALKQHQPMPSGSMEKWACAAFALQRGYGGFEKSGGTVKAVAGGIAALFEKLPKGVKKHVWNGKQLIKVRPEWSNPGINREVTAFKNEIVRLHNAGITPTLPAPWKVHTGYFSDVAKSLGDETRTASQQVFPSLKTRYHGALDWINKYYLLWTNGKNLRARYYAARRFPFNKEYHRSLDYVKKLVSQAKGPGLVTPHPATSGNPLPGSWVSWLRDTRAPSSAAVEDIPGFISRTVENPFERAYGGITSDAPRNYFHVNPVATNPSGFFKRLPNVSTITEESAVWDDIFKPKIRRVGPTSPEVPFFVLDEVPSLKGIEPSLAATARRSNDLYRWLGALMTGTGVASYYNNRSKALPVQSSSTSTVATSSPSVMESTAPGTQVSSNTVKEQMPTPQEQANQNSGDADPLPQTPTATPTSPNSPISWPLIAAATIALGGGGLLAYQAYQTKKKKKEQEEQAKKDRMARSAVTAWTATLSSVSPRIR